MVHSTLGQHATSISGNEVGAPARVLDFRALGSFEVLVNGTDVTPRAPMQARLLAVLLLRANRVVSVGGAVEELWDDPPRLAKKTIQTYVSQLRALLGSINPATGKVLIETHQSGYCLRITPAQSDVGRFEQLVAEADRRCGQGDHLGAAELLRRALADWRGDPLENLEDGRELAARAGLLSEQRSQVLVRRIEEDLKIGLHREVVAELTALVRVDPLDERLCGLLMQAAARSGNPALALEAYRRLRSGYAEELGLDPSPWIQQLQLQILRVSGNEGVSAVAAEPDPVRSPLLAAVSAEPAPPHEQIPAPPHDFCGRDREIEWLRSALGQPGAAKVAAIIGPTGVGKSALLQRVAAGLKESFPDGQLYLPMHLPDGSARPVLEAVAVLGRALTWARWEAELSLDEQVGRLRTLLASRRLLVALDDAASAEQILPLLPGGSGSAVVITSQPRLAGLGVPTLELEPLTPAEARELLLRIVGRERIGAEPEAVARIAALCEYLPLAVRAAGERLLSRGAWSAQKLADRLGDERRRHAELNVNGLALRRRLDVAAGRLSGDSRRALRQLCGLGPAWFDLKTAAAALKLDCLAAEAPVGDLVGSHLLKVRAQSAESAAFRFSDLVRLNFSTTS